jgi:hypothetical protein
MDQREELSFLLNKTSRILNLLIMKHDRTMKVILRTYRTVDHIQHERFLPFLNVTSRPTFLTVSERFWS